MTSHTVMFPRTPFGDLTQRPFQMQAFCKPVFGVGGDFYDTFALDAHRHALCIGDVCGKGTEASLLVAFCQMYLRQYAPHSPGPAQTLSQLAQALRPHLPPEGFITLFYGVLDTQGGTLSFSRAGHEPALLLSPTNGPEAPFSILPLVGEGMALGLGTPQALQASLQTCQVPWRPGQTLLLYTDGLTERSNPAGTPYGLDGLISALHSPELSPLASAKGLHQHLLAHWQLYGQGEPLHDDVTLLTLSLGPDTGTIVH